MPRTQRQCSTQATTSSLMSPPAFISFDRWPRWALAFYPVAVLACFGTFVVRTRMALGYWPSYDHPDPKRLGFAAHYDLVFFLLTSLPVAAAVAFIYGLTFFVVTRPVPWWRIYWPVAASFLLSSFAIVLDLLNPD